MKGAEKMLCFLTSEGLISLGLLGPAMFALFGCSHSNVSVKHASDLKMSNVFAHFLFDLSNVVFFFQNVAVNPY